VFEDGVEQEISHFTRMEAPFNVAFLLDTSGGMRLQDADVCQAAAALIEKLNANDRIMIVSFGSEVYLNSEFTADRFIFGRAVNQVLARGGTRLFDAVGLALKKRLKQIESRKAIFLFTDGIDTESRLSDARRTLELAEESGALIYTIHYDTTPDVVEHQVHARIGANVVTLGPSQSNASHNPLSGGLKKLGIDLASRRLQDMVGVEVSLSKEGWENRTRDHYRNQYRELRLVDDSCLIAEQ
jgi:VWFA-related protein